MAVTKEYKTNLIMQVIASEVQYAEIDERAQILRDKAMRTADEQRILDDYEKKLTHDRGLIAKWKIMLKGEGVSSIPVATRQKILDDCLVKADEKITVVAKRELKEQKLKNIVDSPDAPTDLRQDALKRIDGQAQRLIKLQNERQRAENSRRIVEDLKKRGETWPS